MALALKTDNKIRILSEPLIYYRVHEANDSRELKNAEHVFNIFGKYGYLLTEKELDMLYCRANVNLGIKALRLNDGKSSKYFRKAMHHANLQKQFYVLPGLICAILPHFLRFRALAVYYSLQHKVNR